jgi:hypothetical protein
MYSFPHPQAIFDGGGTLFIQFASGTFSVGTSARLIDYTIPLNYVLHLQLVQVLANVGGTGGYFDFMGEIRSAGNVLLGRFYRRRLIYNEPLVNTQDVLPLSLIIPGNYRIVLGIYNGLSVSAYAEGHLIGILYEVFRT